MTKCEVEVEKILQSPTTPVYALAYLVKMFHPEEAEDFEKELLAFLEEKAADYRMGDKKI